MTLALRQTYQVSLRYLRALLRQPAFVMITLVQPLMIGQVIERVEAQDPLGWLIGLLVAFVVLQSATSAYQHYLLQRAGTAVVLLTVLLGH